MVEGPVGMQCSIQHYIQEAILVMKSCAGSTMRCGSENFFRKTAVLVNACIMEMKEIRKGKARAERDIRR